MSIQHKSLAEGRWVELGLVTQLANVGSEVERAIRWREKGNGEYSRVAFERALELLDLTLAGDLPVGALREVARARELFVDWYMGENSSRSTAESWRKYFLEFAVAARPTR